VTRLQRYSSYAFGVFTVFHVANTSLIPLVTQSVQASDSYLLLTRPYYQSRPFEPLLVVAPLAVHIISGLALRVYRRQQQLRRYGAEGKSDRRKVKWPVISGISALGFATTWLVVGHAIVNRLVPLYIEGSSANVGLEYVAHGFAKHPITATAGFATLVGVSVWHMTWGWAKWMGWTPSQVTIGGSEGGLEKKRRWYLVNGAAALSTLVWLAGGLGVVGRGGKTIGWQAGVYDSLYKQIPVFGRWY
jgi:hypothetical protein